MERRIALVTGGASGIGQAVAERLSSDHHVVVADIDRTRGELLSKKIQGEYACADLKLAGDCRRLVTETVRRHARLDVLINNAGFQHIDPIERFPLNRWQEMLSVMLSAPFLLTKHAWPVMKKRGFGRVINIASIHSIVASPFKAAYVAAKHGLVGFTKVAALEGAEFGITVNAVSPAYVKTPLVERQIAQQAATRGISEDSVIESVMLQPAAIKTLIEPADVAEIVAYLCTDGAGRVTGSNWTIDLGWTAR